MNNDEIVKSVIRELEGKLKSEGDATYEIERYSIFGEEDGIISVDLNLSLASGISGELKNVYFNEDEDDEASGDAVLNLIVDFDALVGHGLSDFGALLRIDKNNKIAHLDTVKLTTQVFDHIGLDHIYHINVVENNLADISTLENLDIDHSAVFPFPPDNAEVIIESANLKLKAFDLEITIDD